MTATALLGTPVIGQLDFAAELQTVERRARVDNLNNLQRSSSYARACFLSARISPNLAIAAPDPPPLIAAFDQIAIYVRDPDVSAEFYKSLFGLKQTPAPVPFARWLMMSNGVMLHIVKGRTTTPGHSKWDHIALACADMDQLTQLLADRHARR